MGEVINFGRAVASRDADAVADWVNAGVAKASRKGLPFLVETQPGDELELGIAEQVGRYTHTVGRAHLPHITDGYELMVVGTLNDAQTRLAQHMMNHLSRDGANVAPGEIAYNAENGSLWLLVDEPTAMRHYGLNCEDAIVALHRMHEYESAIGSKRSPPVLCLMEVVSDFGISKQDIMAYRECGDLL